MIGNPRFGQNDGQAHNIWGLGRISDKEQCATIFEDAVDNVFDTGSSGSVYVSNNTENGWMDFQDDFPFMSDMTQWK